jgi:hypothetical protein
MKMTPSDDNLFKKVEDDMETPGELTEEDKDFLKSLETMAAEIDGEADPSS